MDRTGGQLEHDSESGYRFSGKIMLKQEDDEHDSTQLKHAPDLVSPRRNFGPLTGL
jgi:hypothetical protein